MRKGSYDYQNQLNELKKIDPELFQILEIFLYKWKNFDYSDTDPITGCYHSLLFEERFIDDIDLITKLRKNMKNSMMLLQALIILSLILSRQP
ncbi:MAG TPA: hypothetical protein DCZ19_13140 [Porphyromonadaceae bacterium]|nr:MAG: hypothetical protein A2W87_02000 [Bacteroidetes bacterium GWC2_46_850]HBB02001.1 hypothetical protein [Porphyromonadaceae bacterium]HCC19484.1 hypothetical protein [Porphyromonadaceae bacterium]